MKSTTGNLVFGDNVFSVLFAQKETIIKQKRKRAENQPVPDLSLGLQS